MTIMIIQNLVLFIAFMGVRVQHPIFIYKEQMDALFMNLGTWWKLSFSVTCFRNLHSCQFILKNLPSETVRNAERENPKAMAENA